MARRQPLAPRAGGLGKASVVFLAVRAFQNPHGEANFSSAEQTHRPVESDVVGLACDKSFSPRIPQSAHSFLPGRLHWSTLG